MGLKEIKERLENSAAGNQWKRIGVSHHHGINVPLFSLKQSSSCGIGEYLDLIPLIDFCVQVKMDTIQLLPLNDTGTDTSPYNAISAYALNPIHISLTALAGTNSDLTFASLIKEMQGLNSLKKVDYIAVREKKEKFLREYFHKFGKAILHSSEYKEFTKQNDWLEDYGIFKGCKNKFSNTSWEDWPKHNSSTELKKEFAEEINFHSFVQFLCAQQMKNVKKYADQNKVFLKGDIPILISRDSVDVWRNPQFFCLEYAAGAPPDMYSEEGQYWGFPTYHWENLEKEGYGWWKKRLSIASDYYHLCRIDHIVGFFRIWSIPVGQSAKKGQFIPSDPAMALIQGEMLMKMILEATPTMLPIGEDLGSIPPEVRVSLKSLGICGTKVCRWEREWDGDQSFIDPKTYTPESMSTVSTHDSETLKQWWAYQHREAQEFCEQYNFSYASDLTQDLHMKILKQSHNSGSLFHINLLQEYLSLFPELSHACLNDERVNVPGVVSSDNWSTRYIPTISEMQSHAALKKFLTSLVAFNCV